MTKTRAQDARVSCCLLMKREEPRYPPLPTTRPRLSDGEYICGLPSSHSHSLRQCTGEHGRRSSKTTWRRKSTTVPQTLLQQNILSVVWAGNQPLPTRQL